MSMGQQTIIVRRTDSGPPERWSVLFRDAEGTEYPHKDLDTAGARAACERFAATLAERYGLAVEVDEGDQ